MVRRPVVAKKLQMLGGEDEVLQPNEIRVEEKQSIQQVFKRLG